MSVDVRVVTDSTAYLPIELIQEQGIEVIPLHVAIGDTDRAEGVDVTAAEVAAALREHASVTTSRPTPQAFLETYERLAQDGATHVVSLHLSSKISGTHEAAVLAAAQSPIPVTVIDSRTVGMAMGYAAVSAAEAARGGADAETVAAVARGRIEGSAAYFYVDTLEHLRRGGRIGAASAFLGSALAIKPILKVEDGQIQPVEKVRTSTRAIARLEARVIEHIRGLGLRVDLAVHHLDAATRAAEVAEQLLVSAPGDPQIRVLELGAVIGAHVGPGTVAVTVSPRPGEPLTALDLGTEQVVDTERTVDPGEEPIGGGGTDAVR